jgi:anti-anti-sigma factor
MSDVQILYLRDKLNEQTVRTVENDIMNLLSQGYSRIILEAEEVNYVDWPAVGKILGLKRVLRHFEGDIKLAGLPEEVKEPFNRFGACHILEMYSNLDEAMTSFTQYADESVC